MKIEPKVGDVWEMKTYANTTVVYIAPKNETEDRFLGVYFKPREVHYSEWFKIGQFNRLLERDGKKVPGPEKAKTTIKRFDIFRDRGNHPVDANNHGGMPYINARNDQGTPLKWFQDRELIHGYIYSEEGNETVTPLPFKHSEKREEPGIANIVDVGDQIVFCAGKRILPVAVLVEVEE